MSLMMISLLGCVEPYAPEVLSIDYGVLVIDGYFVPNDTTRITLSRTVTMDALDNSMPEPLATVRIENDRGFSLMLTPHDGHLYTAPPVAADLGASYRMVIHTADGRTYESDFVPLKKATQIDSVAVDEETNGEKVSFNVFSHDIKNDSRYYSYQYDETWEYVASGYSLYLWYDGRVIPRERAAALYNCWMTRPSIDIRLTSTAQLSEDMVYNFPVVEMFQSDRRLYFAYSVYVRQYVLTPEAYSYWTIINRNSEGLGTLFDPQPEQPNSNYSCTSEPGRPVIGFFSATEVTTKRVFIDRFDLRGPHDPYQPTGYEQCECRMLDLHDVSEETLRGSLIVDGVYEDVTSRLLGYIICPDYCLDCRMKGGTTQRPTFWE